MIHADDTDLFPVNFEIFSHASDSIVAETELTSDQQQLRK
jgi:hypothetical protein